MTQVHQSRWGYHPCDYATFLLLKELNQFYLGALRRFAEWKRWRRKQPQNRLLCKKRRNAQGQVIGKEILGPRSRFFVRSLRGVRRWAAIAAIQGKRVTRSRAWNGCAWRTAISRKPIGKRELLLNAQSWLFPWPIQARRSAA
jgi:hypothetical protein